ncbi:MAG: HDIG domain-containing metalloprotein [bacterium]
MRTYEELFPLIKKLEPELKEKVINTFDEARKLGGWEIEELERIPFTLLIPETKESFVTHTNSVAEIAYSSAKILMENYPNMNINEQYLIAGALLHDVGKLVEYKKKDSGYATSQSGKLLRHPFSGANIAYKNGLPAEVVHIIATHAKEGDGGFRSIESILVHHADFINFESIKVVYGK